MVQDVLMNLWKFLSVRNKCLNILKHNDAKNSMMTSLKLSLIDESADYNAHLVWELKKLISKSLSELPYEQRRAFEMSRFEGKTYHQDRGIPDIPGPPQT